MKKYKFRLWKFLIPIFGMVYLLYIMDKSLSKNGKEPENFNLYGIGFIALITVFHAVIASSFVIFTLFEYIFKII